MVSPFGDYEYFKIIYDFIKLLSWCLYLITYQLDFYIVTTHNQYGPYIFLQFTISLVINMHLHRRNNMNTI